MPPLTSEERDAFLAEPGVLMRVATVDPAGAPAVTPIWFLYERGRVLFTPRAESAWLAHLRRDPRVALCIDEQPLPYRKVLVRGRAELLHDLGEDDAWRALYLRIAERYVPPDEAASYVQGTRDQPRALFAVDLARAQLTTWRMPRPGEPPSGIWHPRYYAPGSMLDAAAKLERSSG